MSDDRKQKRRMGAFERLSRSFHEVKNDLPKDAPSRRRMEEELRILRERLNITRDDSESSK